jgi:ferredoxin
MEIEHPHKSGIGNAGARTILGGAVLFAADSCLSRQTAHVDCVECVKACPAGIIEIANRRPEIGLGCISCGRCAGACPTGALKVRRFDYPLELAGTIALECARVPLGARVEGAIAVPCLAGVTAEDIAALHKAGATRTIFVDRGWCASCPAGCNDSQPWAKAAQQAANWLAAAGLPASSLPAGMAADLPARRALPLGGAADPVDRSRRALLARVRFVAPDVRPPSPPSAFARASVRAPRRERRLAALAAVAARSGREVPASVFPDVRASAACELHGVCVAVCPTGALTRFEDSNGGVGRLEFNPFLCVACGECAGRCPELALEVIAQGESDVAARRRTLICRGMATCSTCDRPFAPEEGESHVEGLCPTCRKSKDLAKAGFALPRAAGPPAGPGERCVT